MTGMSMLGKMSVGIETIDSNPSTAMSSETTTKVYGRRRASLTIHIRRRRFLRQPPRHNQRMADRRGDGSTLGAVFNATHLCASDFDVAVVACREGLRSRLAA